MPSNSLRSCFFVATALFALASLPGQLDVSPRHVSAPGEGSGLLPGCGVDFRLQVIISAGRLKGALNRTLTELQLRRSTGHAGALVAGQADFQVLVSVARTTPHDPSQFFSQNEGAAPVTVFNGLISMPASAAVAGPVTAPWTAKYLVRAPFGRQFVYTGGDLCVEIRGRPRSASANLFWPIDHEAQQVSGSVVRYGSSCAPWSPNPHTAFGSDGTLRIGCTTWLWSFGRYRASPLMMLGVSKIDPGIDLGPMGAPGCKQYLVPLAIVPLFYNPPVAGTQLGSVALPLKLPVDRSLMSKSFAVQFAEDESGLPRSQWTNASRLSTSNGLWLTVSSRAPDLGLAMISSRDESYGRVTQPTWGEVSVASAPIIRFILK